jgi:hypothetical protein
MTMSELIRRVSELADAKDNYWGEGVLKKYPHYPLLRAGEDEPPSPAEEAELELLLASLPEVELYTLFALHRLGQGRISAADFGTCRASFRTAFTPADVIAEMVQGAYLSADFEDAADRLRSLGLDAGSLQLSPT